MMMTADEWQRNKVSKPDSFAIKKHHQTKTHEAVTTTLFIFFTRNF
jgi:hypothetical protein